MTTPPVDPYEQPPGYQGEPAYPPYYPPGQAGLPAPISYPTGYPAHPGAPYGFDPLTGRPYSDKSKVAAGLLQLLPGVLLGLGGIGRLYAGNVSLGVIQIVATVIGWISFWCGFVLVVPFFVFVGVWLWFVIDGILIMTGQPVDGEGRPLRA